MIARANSPLRNRGALRSRGLLTLMLAAAVILPMGAFVPLRAVLSAEELQEEATIRHSESERRAARHFRSEKADLGHSRNGWVLPPTLDADSDSTISKLDDPNSTIYAHLVYAHSANSPLRL